MFACKTVLILQLWQTLFPVLGDSVQMADVHLHADSCLSLRFFFFKLHKASRQTKLLHI